MPEPLTVCEVCGGPLPSFAKVGVCRRNPACKTENMRRHERKRKQYHCRVCCQPTHNLATHGCAGTPERARARKRRERKRLHSAWTANLVTFLNAHPAFLAEWFESDDPAVKARYLARYVEANPKVTVRWRFHGTTAPTLARLQLPGHAPFYGISGGLIPRAAPQPAEYRIVRMCWNSHAEGHVFAQAIAAGYAGGEGALSLDRAPCDFCMGSMPGFARALDLSALTVNWPQHVYKLTALLVTFPCRFPTRLCIFSAPPRGRLVSMVLFSIEAFICLFYGFLLACALSTLHG